MMIPGETPEREALKGAGPPLAGVALALLGAGAIMIAIVGSDRRDLDEGYRLDPTLPVNSEVEIEQDNYAATEGCQGWPGFNTVLLDIDWVFTDPGARKLYDHLRAQHMSRYQAVLQAQLHNPDAYDRIRAYGERCTNRRAQELE